MNAQIALLPQYDNVVPFPTKSNEWYTPSRYIEAARAVMGSIDLDPASCELANRTVKATRYYTAQENGLAQEWSGNVWLNPPFNMPGVKMSQFKWAEKLCQEYLTGHIKQAIMTMYSTGKNRWFHEVWEMLDGLMSIPYRRPYFLRPNGDRIELMYAVFFFYMGKNEQAFIDIFSEFGTVARRVSQPKRAVTPLSLWEGVL